MRGSRLKKKRQSSLSGEAGKRRLILAAQTVLFLCRTWQQPQEPGLLSAQLLALLIGIPRQLTGK